MMMNYQLFPNGAQWNLATEDSVAVCQFDSKQEALENCTELLSGRKGSLEIHLAGQTDEEECPCP